MPTPNRPRHKTALLLLALLTSLAILPLGGNPPAWWTQSDKAVLILTDSPNDFAAINQGQLKHIATQAAEHLNEELPGGAGADVNGYIYGEAFTNTENATDFAVANIGQVKFIAKKFYDRLIAVGYTDAYPWADSGDPANDHGLANIGQLKALFAFDVSAPDEDELPQWWIDHHFPGQSGILPGHDPDEDGLTNLQEYELGLNPSDHDTDGDVLPDWWEPTYGFDSLNPNSDSDTDSDSLSALAEFLIGSDPLNAPSANSVIVHSPLEK